MKLLKIIFPKKKTPIKSVRRKIILGGDIYSISLKAGSRNSCKRTEGLLTVTLKEMTRENFETYITAWYRREARKLFKTSFEKWHDVMRRMGYDIPMPQIKIFDMRRAWGRCYYTKGLVTMNLRLATAPAECIDCIVLHELCHFLVQSHSKQFYALMTHFDPNWREKEAALKQFALQNKIFSAFM